ncbi:MAG: restriction endonuclease [Candidatus Aenigmarchaeota archaeon]|nr:restriction endonuclease [Candidatus Aenigmarchaeota archaeon]
MTLFVTKADGSKQSFDKSKIIKTCLRLKASREIAKKIANKIEREAYDGISTRKIIKLVYKYLSEYKPELKHTIDLRESISTLRSKPDFEIFVSQILKSLGYTTIMNQVVPGKCVEHEVDIIAIKGKEIIYVEVKHHVNPHTYTGLRIFLEVWSAFEDLKDGFKLGNHEFNFSKALVVSNTKISSHAERYARCKGIAYLGWKYPKNQGLERLIERNKLYPLTFLKGLEEKELEKLGDIGIVTLKQFIQIPSEKISKLTRIKRKRIEEIENKVRKVLGIKF